MWARGIAKRWWISNRYRLTAPAHYRINRRLILAEGWWDSWLGGLLQFGGVPTSLVVTIVFGVLGVEFDHPEFRYSKQRKFELFARSCLLYFNWKKLVIN